MQCDQFNEWARETTLAKVAEMVTEWEAERGRPEKTATYQSVQDWIKKGVPPTRVICVEALSGIPRTTLRPDVYPPEESQSSAA